MIEIDKPSDFFHVDANGNFTRPKSVRRIAKVTCGAAGCTNHDNQKSPQFKRCARCTTLYCSKECQKRDWKAHKPICTLAVPESIKILMDIATIPLLREHFATLVILKFGLHLLDAKSLEAISLKPLEMDVYIQHEPVNVRDFLHLFNVSSGGWERAPPLMGIPQVVDVRSDKQKLLSDKDGMKQWKAYREDELAKRPGQLTIIANVRYHQSMGGRRVIAGPSPNLTYVAACSQSVNTYFKISPRAFAIVKQGTYPPIPISFDNFKYQWQPATMNVENHIEFINADIRWDIDNGNQLRIGTKLPDFEKEMIWLASYPSSETPVQHPDSMEFINFIRKKIRRENVFRMAAAYYEHESDAIPKVSVEDLKNIRVLQLGRE